MADYNFHVSAFQIPILTLPFFSFQLFMFLLASSNFYASAFQFLLAKSNFHASAFKLVAERVLIF
ncbi:hypothetical protein DMB65_21775 [Flavobacterium cheongpyeongense]|uniref:Uncharacterized protein n=1 Tax=Flavobacterium cheongpyeongense TaxID=2212651 RepID=A0A2V4BIE5_9FLAO|nr:hypothetical protein DMB65_21775 [Flavobacterium cheongpyeongense]